MTTIAPTCAALNHYCGFPAGSSRARIRALTEGGLIAPGAPGKSVEIDEADFCLVLLAVASAAPLHAVADTVTELAECVPSGIDVNVMPETIRPARTTAFEVLPLVGDFRDNQGRIANWLRDAAAAEIIRYDEIPARIRPAGVGAH